VTLPIEDDMEEEVDKAWMNLLLHVIGGSFDKTERDMINGMIFSIRDKHLRISLWCNAGSDAQRGSLVKIGEKIRELSQLDSRYIFGYQVHQKALKHDLDN
jgi:hypothetical protein